MAKKRKEKIRAEFRKNRGDRTRRSDWTQRYEEHGLRKKTLISRSGSAAKAISHESEP